MMGRWRVSGVAAVLWAVLWAGAAAPQAPGPAGPASPAPGQEFTVAEVEIDRSATTGLAARDAAITEAQRTAFRRLIERMVPRERLAGLPRVTDAQISDMVDHFEIQRERITGTRYAATFTVAFRSEAVQAYLGRGDQTQVATPLPTPNQAPGAPQVSAGSEQRYTVRVILRSMADLVRVQRQLDGVPGLRRAEQTSLSVGEATFDLTFAGTEAALRDALARQDLTLGRDPSGLTLSARAQAAPR
jgi:hypothetical protein